MLGYAPTGAGEKMIATYNQVKFEMRAKEAEFTRELRRAQSSQSKAFDFITKFFGQTQTRTGRRTATSR